MRILVTAILENISILKMTYCRLTQPDYSLDEELDNNPLYSLTLSSNPDWVKQPDLTKSDLETGPPLLPVANCHLAYPA